MADPELAGEADRHLDAVTKIPAELNGLEHRFVAGAENRYMLPWSTGISVVADTLRLRVFSRTGLIGWAPPDTRDLQGPQPLGLGLRVH
jgi:hypothetical protein